MQVQECPQCGAPANPSDRKCGYCKAEFFVTSVAYMGKLDQSGVGKYLKHYKNLTQQESGNAEAHLGLGITYLHMGMWPPAMKAFEKVMELSPEIPQAYYYCALARVAGRRLMTMPLSEVRQIEMALNAATQLDADFTSAKVMSVLLKRDYFETNGLKVTPPSVDQLTKEIQGKEVNSTELALLRKSVRVGDSSLYSIVREA